MQNVLTALVPIFVLILTGFVLRQRRAAHHLVDVAHRECFIANSLNSAVVIEPSVTRI